jgi:cytochrome c
MRNFAMPGAGLLAAMLAGCGSESAPPPPVTVEKIVVREPGAPAANAIIANAATDGTVDLVALGESAFQACAGCHNAAPDAPNMAGPNLHGVVGRAAGSLEGYAYSPAMAGSGLIWDRASLDRFLANPSGYVPGTAMVAGAVRDGERRAAIVAYLAAQGE